MKLFKRIRWYLQQLKWSSGGEEAERSTSWVELALDFYAATRVPLMLPGADAPGTLAEQVKIFAGAARGVARLCKDKVPPGKPLRKCNALSLIHI